MRTPWANLRIVWVDLPSRVDRWGFTKIGKGVHYLIWQEMAFRRARELHATIGFDLVHHVSCGTISAPPRLWRLGVPFLWGPIGGGQTSPKSFRRYFRGERAGEILRSARVRLLPFYPPLRKAARHSVILATNRETIHILEEAGASVVYPLLDGALPNEYIPAEPVVRKARADTVFIWAGWHEPRNACRSRSKRSPRLILISACGLPELHMDVSATNWKGSQHCLGLLTASNSLGYSPGMKCSSNFMRRTGSYSPVFGIHSAPSFSRPWRTLFRLSRWITRALPAMFLTAQLSKCL